jgi:hypothetical protein
LPNVDREIRDEGERDKVSVSIFHENPGEDCPQSCGRRGRVRKVYVDETEEQSGQGGDQQTFGIDAVEPAPRCARHNAKSIDHASNPIGAALLPETARIVSQIAGASVADRDHSPIVA